MIRAQKILLWIVLLAFLVLMLPAPFLTLAVIGDYTGWYRLEKYTSHGQ
jgi:hypothetical protein